MHWPQVLSCYLEFVHGSCLQDRNEVFKEFFFANTCRSSSFIDACIIENLSLCLPTPKAYAIKLFTTIINSVMSGNDAYVTVRLFHPSLKFAGKTRSLLPLEAPLDQVG